MARCVQVCSHCFDIQNFGICDGCSKIACINHDGWRAVARGLLQRLERAAAAFRIFHWCAGTLGCLFNDLYWYTVLHPPPRRQWAKCSLCRAPAAGTSCWRPAEASTAAIARPPSSGASARRWHPRRRPVQGWPAICSTRAPAAARVRRGGGRRRAERRPCGRCRRAGAARAGSAGRGPSVRRAVICTLFSWQRVCDSARVSGPEYLLFFRPFFF
jgi:hypothetical protein